MEQPARPGVQKVAAILAWSVLAAGLAWNLYGVFFGWCSTTLREGSDEAVTSCGFAGFGALFLALLIVTPAAWAAAAVTTGRTLTAWLALFAYVVLSAMAIFSFGPHLAVGVPLMALAVGLHTWARGRALHRAPPPELAANRL